MGIAGLLVATAAAALIGYWMWRRTTATLYYPCANSTIRPAHVSQEDYEARVIARRKRVALVKTTMAAMASGVVRNTYEHRHFRDNLFAF